ncbi:MAG TPA: hypothetical protein VGX78_01785 [Pirellulales bacterium]|jgi:hypothetical protein|nr:hypothetical protein [Pirellulales bacterium]
MRRQHAAPAAGWQGERCRLDERVWVSRHAYDLEQKPRKETKTPGQTRTTIGRDPSGCRRRSKIHESPSAAIGRNRN